MTGFGFQLNSLYNTPKNGLGTESNWRSFRRPVH